MHRILTLTDPEARSALCRTILADLPDWFGRPDAAEAYVRAIATQTTFAWEVEGLQAGVASLSQTTPDAYDIHVMGVLRQYHRRGGGRNLMAACEAHARANGAYFLTVQTLSPSRPDPFYQHTRSFYAACGFAALAEFPEHWGPDTPMLLMGKQL